VDFNMGESQILRGFTVVILGGIGSVPGALIGGLLLGVTEGITVDIAGSSWQVAASFVLLFVFLVARPQGIFGKPLIDRA
jgi:branched-chain amino acid transport system permease protein